MTQTVVCPNCGATLPVTVQPTAQRMSCPQCGVSLEIPAAFVPMVVAEPIDEPYTVAPLPPVEEDPLAFLKSTPQPMYHGNFTPPAGSGGEYNPYSAPTSISPGYIGNQPWIRPHNAGTALTLSILGWVICVLLQIPAVIIARNNLNDMKAGRVDPSGRGMAIAAIIISSIQFGLVALMMVGWLLSG